MARNRGGDPIIGQLTSTATIATEIPIYNAGTTTARVLAADECVEVDTVILTGSSTFDLDMFLGATSTPAAGEYVLRALSASFILTGRSMGGAPRAGAPGSLPYLLKTSAGTMNVTFTGRIVKVNGG